MRTPLLLALAAIILSGCATPPTPAETTPSQTGGITYDDQNLGQGKHLLVVKARPAPLETENAITQRMNIFASTFAATQCPSGVKFLTDPKVNQKLVIGDIQCTKTYLFVATDRD